MADPYRDLAKRTNQARQAGLAVVLAAVIIGVFFIGYGIVAAVTP